MLGSVVIEAALTLPIVLLLIFFALEITRLNIAQVTMEAIAAEATFNFIAKKMTIDFENIIKKHMTFNCGEVRWYFAVYENLDTMFSIFPYGAEDIYWYPDKSLYMKTDASFIQKSGDMELTDPQYPENSFSSDNPSDNYKTLSGKVFVLTFVCDFKFSLDLIKKIFSNGRNTMGETSHYIIWSRGCGICN
ncbi:MAG: pilus assembly protein [Holosporaceae bacterium]|nr:pilus assembly protein [Holosporaceae bacterium]